MQGDTPLSLHDTVDWKLDEDARRARELYRHVQPQVLRPGPRDGFGEGGDKAASSLRAALEPYVQLACLRCEASRSFITLIDRELQYFIAEAATNDANDSAQAFQERKDLLFLGCGSVEKSGKLCEVTIKLPPKAEQYSIFEVKDLLQDPRYSGLPFVTGGPQLRYYAGTPLTTKKGINIGSLCLMDSKPRDGLTKDQISVLGWLAESVITYLQTNREALEGRRSKAMSDGLQAFVQGRSKFAPEAKWKLDSDDIQSESPVPGRKKSRSPSTESMAESVNGEKLYTQESLPVDIISRPSRIEKRSDQMTDSGRDRTTASSDGSSDERNELDSAKQDEAGSQGHRFTFKRAANILRHCFETGPGDGVMFLEAGTGLVRSTEESHESGSGNDLEESCTSPTEQAGTHTSFDPVTSAFAKSVKNPAPVLAYSTRQEPALRGKVPANHSALGHIDQEVLRQLCKRYPRGTIWILVNGLRNATSSDDEQKPTGHQDTSPRRSMRYQRDRAEATVLERLFPDVIQIIFQPLWDAGSANWSSACFIWSTSEARIYSKSMDLGFLGAFGKTIMAECSQLDTLLADKQKADFIGSVSHELRSPLHGILAGAEFLGETTTTAFQRSLIHTVEACGQTLLDTIDHVLDFSKINSLDRNWRNNRLPIRRTSEREIGHGAQLSSKKVPSGAPPLLRLYALTDVAAIAEEVVEGLSAGRIFSKASDLTDMSAVNRGQTSEKGMHRPSKVRRNTETEVQLAPAPIEVILDIQKQDWVFMAQAGAIRRIVMNLFGNAVKYTTTGTIKVQLGLKDIPKPDNEQESKLLALRISDTGKGISAKFLASRLFVPFAQEDTLAPGTGLGLSIVRTIVTMMGGTIDIRSKLGVGTTVDVSLPLNRAHPESETIQTSSDTYSVHLGHNDSIQFVREEAPNFTVTIFDHYANNDGQGTFQEHSKVLTKYLEDWFGFSICRWEDRAKADILILDGRDASEIDLDNREPAAKPPAVIILWSDASRHSQAEADAVDSDQLGIFEYLAKPCGPHKLAKVLHACLNRMKLFDGLSQKDSESNSIDDISNPLDLTKSGARSIDAESSEKDTSDSPTLHDPETGSTTPPIQPCQGEKIAIPTRARSSSTSPLTPHVQNLTTWSDMSPPKRTKSSGGDLDDSGPRLLLVDDNKINLQLLQTFMRKRKYKHIDSAEDGSIAVSAFKAAASSPLPISTTNTSTTSTTSTTHSTDPSPSPNPPIRRSYDMVFMDISMPVMNGFEATRAIRQFEAERQLKPAVIVALTGLASARDEAEGFAAGCDVYLTKPLSFRELSRFLGEREREREGEGN